MAARAGEFGVVGTDGITRVLPFKVEMNLDALKNHPVAKLKNFNFSWVRVTDINLSKINEGIISCSSATTTSNLKNSAWNCGSAGRCSRDTG